MTDPDRMQHVGYFPTADYSGEKPVHGTFSVYRDYDHAHLPAVVTGLDGFKRVRETLDTAERDITAYKARRAAKDGDAAAMARARALLAGERVRYAVALIGSARDMIAAIAADRGVDTETGPWADLLDAAGGAFLPNYGFLFRAIERAACRCAIAGTGEVIPPACPVHGTPCEVCGETEGCADWCTEGEENGNGAS